MKIVFVKKLRADFTQGEPAVIQSRIFIPFLSKILRLNYTELYLRVVLYEHETWSLTLRVERRLRVSENRVGGKDKRGLEEIA